MRLLNKIIRDKSTLDALAENNILHKLYLYFDFLASRLIYGCPINHYVTGNFYKRSWIERRKIYTFRNWSKVVATVNDPLYIHFLKEKVDFNIFFAELIGRDWLQSKSMSFEAFELFCKKHNMAIIKPTNGLMGIGITSIVLPQTPDSISAMYDELKSKDILLEEKIIQHPDMVLGGKSVNTIRVSTAYNPHDNLVTIIKCVMRAGRGESIVDNSHSGGCAYEVDINSGYVISFYYAANGNSSFMHPDTDICMLGKKIPYWEEVKKLCIRGALMLPECRYIGWDVAITEKGPIFVEGNHQPDLDMIEFVGSYGYKYQIFKGLGLWK